MADANHESFELRGVVLCAGASKFRPRKRVKSVVVKATQVTSGDSHFLCRDHNGEFTFTEIPAGSFWSFIALHEDGYLRAGVNQQKTCRVKVGHAL